MENSVLRLLAIRPRSVQEIRQYLTKKVSRSTGGVSSADIEALIAKLINAGLLNDTDFAVWLIDSRSKQHGLLRITRELAKFGIPKETYSSLLPNRTQQISAAKMILQKRFSALRNTDRAMLSRAYGYLSRRGFPASIIRTAIDWDGESE